MSTAEPSIGSPSAILHAVWWDAKLHLFALPLPDSTRDDSREASAAHAPPAIPCSISELRAAIEELSPESLIAAAAQESSLTLWLPRSAADTRGDTGDSAQPDLRTTDVQALALGPADAVDFLAGLAPERAPSVSDSLRYWAILARFLLSQLARQKFCPDISEAREEEYVARWRLFVLDRSELTWLERFVAAMPPVCRAVAAAPGTPSDATSLVESFLAEAADCVIRRTLADDEFYQQIPRKAEEFGNWDLKWLAALVGDRRGVVAEAEENASGAAQVRSWIAQAEGDDGPSPKLRFILREPADGHEPSSAPWTLEFELRAADTGETLDIVQVWAERGDQPTLLGSHFMSRRQHLAAMLARAAELFPEVGRALARARSSEIRLTTAEAHAFLRERAPLLEAEGFEIDLPDWAVQADQQLGLQLHVEPRDQAGGGEVSLSRLGLSSLLDFNWRIAVGGDRLTMEEFEQLARQKAPLVKLRGRWIGLDHNAADRALAFLKRQPKGPITLMQAIRLAGGADEADSGLPIIGLSGTDWLENFLRESPEMQVEAFDPPHGFMGTLRPYQLRGVHWLAFLDRIGIGACLADDMGLGKTIQLIALLLHERSDGNAPGPTLLFSPMSVVGNWERELQRFAPSLRVLVHHGPLRLGGDAFVDAARNCDVVLTTYGLAGRESRDFSRVPWHRIAMDEAQKIKNPTAQQTIALRGLVATHRVALTGTPIENHLSELWSIMEVLNPGLLGTATQFRSRFAVPIEKMGDPQRAEQLRRLIRPFILRRLKGDPSIAVDLPEKMEMRVYCNLTPEQAALYERTVATTLQEVDTATGIRRRGLILAALTKLKQVCNHPAHLLRQKAPLDDRSGKCERLIEMLEEVLEEGDCALVFTQFREMGDLLQQMMQDRLRHEIPFLHGGTPIKKRQQMIDAFQDETGRYRIFLLSLKAGGFGLNLTRANHVFHFDRWWNPAVEEQAADRVHRIGQTRRVQVHKFVCIGTVEERIDRLLAEKSALADRIVGSGDEWLTNLSTVELREYLKLSAEAVSET